MTDAATADLSRLVMNLAKASDGSAQSIAEKLVMDAAVQIQSVAQSLAPIKSGALRKSITISHTSKTHITIGPQAPYGAYVEFGTKPHDIRPKNKEYLTFKTRDGRWVRTKLVHHPGTKAQPYMRPAAEQVLSQIAPDLAKQGALKIIGDK